MPEEAPLHVFGLERLTQQRVVEEIDLPHGQVVGRSPVGVYQEGFGLGKRLPGCYGVLFAGMVGRCRLGHRRAFFPSAFLSGANPGL